MLSRLPLLQLPHRLQHCAQPLQHLELNTTSRCLKKEGSDVEGDEGSVLLSEYVSGEGLEVKTCAEHEMGKLVLCAMLFQSKQTHLLCLAGICHHAPLIGEELGHSTGQAAGGRACSAVPL